MNDNQFDPVESTEQFSMPNEPVAGKGKKREVNLLMIFLVVLVSAAVLGAVVISILSASPMALVATGLRNSMEAIEENAFVSFLDEAYNGGSTEISMGLKSLLAGSGLPLDGTASVKIYMDAENKQSAVNLGVKLGQLQDLDASIYFNPESVAVSSQVFLGTTAYGIDLPTVIEDFNASVFRMDGPYSMGITLPDNLKTLMQDSQKFIEDSEKIASALAARLLKTLEKNSEVEKENAVLTLGGEEVKTTAVTVKLDHTQIVAIVTDVIDYLRTDEDFKTFLQEHADYMLASSGSYVDATEFVDELYQQLDEMAADIDEMKKALEESNASVSVVFHINKSGKQLVGIELAGQIDGETSNLSICAGPDLKDAKEVRFQADANGEAFTATYLVKVNDKDAFVSLLDLRENGQDVMKADIRWDKQTGALEFLATDGTESTLSVQGTLALTDETLTATVDSVSLDNNKTELGVSVALRTSDKMPTAPVYKNILKMTEAEVKSLVDELSQAALQLTLGLMAK